MTLTPEQRRSIADKIKALLSKTVDNGASEAEAMAAVMMAQKLMDKYQITMSETEVQEEGFLHESIKITDCYHRWFCHGTVNAIAELTNTRAIYHGSKSILFYGYGQDVEFASWVYRSLRDLIVKASVQHSNSDPENSSYMLRKSFIFGAASRISSRMYKEVREREAAREGFSKSTALVVVDRGTLVDNKIKEMFPKLGKASHQSSRNLSVEAFRAGQAKGDNARWDKPIETKPSHNIKLINN